VHPPGYRGASGALKCAFADVYTTAGFPAPRKLPTGAREASSIIHENVQAMWEEFYADYAPEVYYCSELLVEVDAGKWTFRSPVDAVWLDKPPVYRAVDGYDSDGPVPTLPPDAVVFKAVDVKTGAPYGMTKYRKMAERGEVPDAYKAQLHVYMAALGIREMDIVYVSKTSLDDAFSVTVHFDEDYWQEVVAFNDRKADLLDVALSRGFQAFLDDVRVDDLTWFKTDDDFRCRYCPLSKVDVEVKGGREFVKLVAPCPPAVKIQRELGHPFQVGSVWRWNRSTVVVDGVDGDTVHFTNTRSHRHYEESVFYCLKNFSRGDGRP